jgi:hypothetical protein
MCNKQNYLQDTHWLSVLSLTTSLAAMPSRDLNVTSYSSLALTWPKAFIGENLEKENYILSN